MEQGWINMSGGRTHMLMYERSDGSFRIPQGMTVCMGVGVDALQKSNVIDGHPIPTPIRVAPLQCQEDVIAQLQFEKQYYKNKYLYCLKQLQDVHELSMDIGRKLEIALQTNALGIQLITSASSTQRIVQDESTQVLCGDQMHKIIPQAAGISGGAAKVDTKDSSARCPPKKRQRKGTGTVDLFA